MAERDRDRQQRIAELTRAEHDALLVAMHRLEASLARAAPRRERAWTNRVRDDFRAVHDALLAHVRSTDTAGGLLAEVLRAKPNQQPRVEALRAEHQELCRVADALETSVVTGASVPDFAAIRREAADLLLALRQHHAREVDLIAETLWTDEGTGD